MSEVRGRSVELLYARVLETGVMLALPVLLVTFALYLAGVIEPAVPVAELPRYWTLSSHEYLAAINGDHMQRLEPVTGWAWVTELHHGDFLTYLGIAVLPVITMVCYAAIIPRLLRQRDRIFAAVASAELVVLLLAASGIFKAAGH